MEVTTHTPDVAQPAALVAISGRLVHLQLAMTTCMLTTLSTVATGNNMGRAKDLSIIGSAQSMDCLSTSHTSLGLGKLVWGVLQGAVRRQQGLVLCQQYSFRI